MDVREIVEIVRRRWAAVVLLFIVTLAVTAAVAMSVPATYAADASVLLQLPVATGEGAPPENPLTALSSGSVSIVADVVAQVVNGEGTRERLAAAGGSPYTVSVAEGAVPLLSIEAVSADRDTALETVGLVDAAIADELAAQQRLAGAAEATFLTSRTLIPADRGRALTDRRTRTVAGLLGVGGVLSLTVVVVVDGVLLRRRAASPASTARQEESPGFVGPVAVPPSVRVVGADGTLVTASRVADGTNRDRVVDAAALMRPGRRVEGVAVERVGDAAPREGVS